MSKDAASRGSSDDPGTRIVKNCGCMQILNFNTHDSTSQHANSARLLMLCTFSLHLCPGCNGITLCSEYTRLGPDRIAASLHCGSVRFPYKQLFCIAVAAYKLIDIIFLNAVHKYPKSMNRYPFVLL